MGNYESDSGNFSLIRCAGSCSDISLDLLDGGFCLMLLMICQDDCLDLKNSYRL